MSLSGETETDIGPSELPYPIEPSAESEAKEAAEFAREAAELANGESAAQSSTGEGEPASQSTVGPAEPPTDPNEGRNLIINYLPSHVDENFLRELFIPYGEIEHVKVVKDKITGQSAGYGFVKYVKAEDAKKAIEALNGREIPPKRIKVSIAKPPTKKTELEKPRNLYISGLPLDWEKEQLQEFVSAFGEVEDVRILHDPITKKPRGVGFVRMATHELALQVIEGLNGQTAGNSKLKLVVKFSDQQGNQPRMKGYPGYGPMYGRAAVRYNPMAPSMAYGGYPGMSAPYGSSYGYGMPGQMPSYGGYPSQPSPYGASGYGSYAQTMQPGASGYGMPSAAPTTYGTASTSTPYASSLVPPPTGAGGGKGQMPGYCLFVLHLPPTATDQALYQLFSNYGTVLSTKIMIDLKTGQPKGFGFVNMETLEQAQLAISALNGYQWGNKRLQVSFKTDGKKSQQQPLQPQQQ